MEEKFTSFSRWAAEKLSSIFNHQKFSKIESSANISVQELKGKDEVIKVSSSEICVNDIDYTFEKKEDNEISEEIQSWKGIGITLLVIVAVLAVFTVIVALFFPNFQVLLSALSLHLFRIHTCGERFYRAAVLEHESHGTGTSEEILAANLKLYGVATRTAAQNGADIVVFAEYGLHPHYKGNRSITKNFAEEVPSPKEKIVNPCDEADNLKYGPILKNLSCMAQQNKIYIVANMVSIKNSSDPKTCSPQNKPSANEVKQLHVPRDGYYLFNTNVVFDRRGNLIVRYYKRHLSHETENDPPLCPENVIFETEFGKFTTFICFDAVFEEPILIIEDGETLNVAASSHSFDVAPFMMTSNSFAISFAIQNKVNILVANGHSPATGTSGSGFYTPSGALAYASYPGEGNRLLISNVPRSISDHVNSREELNLQKFKIDNHNATEIKEEEEEVDFEKKMCAKNPSELVDGYNCVQTDPSIFSLSKLSTNSGTIEGCQNEFCCNLTYESYALEDDYYLGVFYGKLFLSDVDLDLKMCLLLRCDSENGVCDRFGTYSRTVFKHVEIKGNFTSNCVYPYALKSNIRLVDLSQWHYDRNSRVVYDNTEGNSSLLYFGMVSRHFDKDEFYIPVY